MTSQRWLLRIVMASGALLIPLRGEAQGRKIGEFNGDSLAFVAVVKNLKGSIKGTLSINPKPLAHDETIVDAEKDAYDENAEALEQERRQILQIQKVQEANNASRENCPRQSAAPAESNFANCPQTKITKIAIGPLRPGGAYLPGGVDERDDARRYGYLAMRVIVTELAPNGSATTAYDFVITLVSREWKVVKKQILKVT